MCGFLPDPSPSSHVATSGMNPWLGGANEGSGWGYREWGRGR